MDAIILSTSLLSTAECLRSLQADKKSEGASLTATATTYAKTTNGSMRTSSAIGASAMRQNALKQRPGMPVLGRLKCRDARQS